MKLFVTPKGDRWLCAECEEDFAETISEQGWRVAFEKSTPCSAALNANMATSKSLIDPAVIEKIQENIPRDH